MRTYAIVATMLMALSGLLATATPVAAQEPGVGMSDDCMYIHISRDPEPPYLGYSYNPRCDADWQVCTAHGDCYNLVCEHVPCSDVFREMIIAVHLVAQKILFACSQVPCPDLIQDTLALRTETG